MGKRFFERYTTIKYEDLEEYMINISENDETIKQFNDMYDKVVNRNVYKYNENIEKALEGIIKESAEAPDMEEAQDESEGN